MSDSNITKFALADSLKELMGKKSLSKISVSDIVSNCGLTRQAFYYHFKDKFDLMNWIYYTETARFMNTFSVDTDIKHWADATLALCAYMRDNKTFYINALKTTGQNSFQEYLHDYIRVFVQSMIENAAGQEADADKYSIISEIIATSDVAMMVRWAGDGMKEDPEPIIRQIGEIFDGSLMSELKQKGPKSG